MRDLVTALCFIAVFAFAAAWMENRSRERIEGVARIIDGDSLVLDGRRLRLLGIDAPEFDQTCNVAGRTERCGLIAAERLLLFDEIGRWVADLPAPADGSRHLGSPGRG